MRRLVYGNHCIEISSATPIPHVIEHVCMATNGIVHRHYYAVTATAGGWQPIAHIFYEIISASDTCDRSLIDNAIALNRMLRVPCKATPNALAKILDDNESIR